MTTPSPPAAAKQHADEVWRPRAHVAPGDVAGYSRFVGLMRIALPAIAGVLVLLIVVVPMFSANDDEFRVGDSSGKGFAVDALSMVNARYFGTDAKGQPFSVTAKSVRERTGADRRIELAWPQADITLNGGTWMSVEAEGGLYDRSTESLDLSGGVSLFQDQGYEMHTTAATVNLKDGAASSRQPVSGQGPFGELTANGFDLHDKGTVVMFAGPARVMLNLSGGGAK